jgi:hypothetical protein
MTQSSYQYYFAGIMMGLGFGWMIASLLQRVMVEEIVSAAGWANFSVIFYVVLSLIGIFIVARACY